MRRLRRRESSLQGRPAAFPSPARVLGATFSGEKLQVRAPVQPRLLWKPFSPQNCQRSPRTRTPFYSCPKLAVLAQNERALAPPATITLLRGSRSKAGHRVGRPKRGVKARKGKTKWSLKTARYNRKNMEANYVLHFFEHYYMFDKYAKKLRPTLLGSKVVPGSARALASGALKCKRGVGPP